jgi:hypothetical protein
MQAH